MIISSLVFVCITVTKKLLDCLFRRVHTYLWLSYDLALTLDPIKVIPNYCHFVVLPLLPLVAALYLKGEKIGHNSAAKQQISWVVSLWRSPLTFVWPGIPKQRANTAPSSRSEHHLTVLCINEIVPGYVVYLVNVVVTICISQFPSAIGWRKKSSSYNHKTTIWVFH